MQLLLVCIQADYNVSQALAIGELPKTHAKKLIPAGEIPNFVIPAVSAYTLVELIFGNQREQLSEYEPALKHCN